jgi:hypothetical protein
MTNNLFKNSFSTCSMSPGSVIGSPRKKYALFNIHQEVPISKNFYPTQSNSRV